VTAHRQHSDVLLAGLILVGATMWLFAQAHTLFGLDQPARLAMWLFSGFAAAQIARRVLTDLDFAETAIAAIVTMAIVVGMFSNQQGTGLHVDMLIPIATAAGGAIAGALTSRRRSAKPHAVWRVLAAGFAGFGGAIVTAGLAMLVTTSDGYVGLAMCGGGVFGSFAIARFADVNGGHCMVGLAVTLGGMMLLANADFSRFVATMIGLAIGAVVGVIGGAIGARMREARKPKTELPEAQIR